MESESDESQLSFDLVGAIDEESSDIVRAPRAQFHWAEEHVVSSTENEPAKKKRRGGSAPEECRGKHQGWVFTINNPTIGDSNHLKALGEEQSMQDERITYLVFGREVGESGTPHLQGFIFFASARVWSSVINYVSPRDGSAYVVPKSRNSTPAQAAEYCKKDGQFDEFGECPSQGARTDLKDLAYVVWKENWKLTDEVAKPAPDWDRVTTAIRHHRHLEVLINAIGKTKVRDGTIDPTVIWCWGKPGSGKSRWAFETFPEAYVFSARGSTPWFDNYEFEDTVIIDDFRGNKVVGADMARPTIEFSELLRLIDRYKLQVQVKGSMKWLAATRWIITCPFKPEEAWCSSENIAQLTRRITEVKHFEGGIDHVDAGSVAFNTVN